MSTTPYHTQVLAVLPRVLAMLDTDTTSDSYGVADRVYWAWGLSDFGNGTFQGAAHGLARLWRHGLWPYPTRSEVFLRRIDALFRGTRQLTRRDGSLEEAFPREGSFCVTALVAFDLLCALDLLDDHLDEPRRRRWRATIAPLIDYLCTADETHAIISNHLATAVAALVRWRRQVGDERAERRAHVLMQRILQHQSAEGWFREYDGADPAYQSLCLYYLADVHLQRPDLALDQPLRRACTFLSHFVHPDGSFGGVYGSRCARFFVPAGFLALAPAQPYAAAIARRMTASIAQHRVVALDTLDDLNLIPFFNAYCWSAVLAESPLPPGAPPLPCDAPPFRHHFVAAGLLIDRGTKHYTVINTLRGGIVQHYAADHHRIDAGVVVRDRAGRRGSTQGQQPTASIELDEHGVTITTRFSAMPKTLPQPWHTLVLRLLALTLFRHRAAREWVKRQIVARVITGIRPWPARNQRRITFGAALVIEDHTSAPPGYTVEASAHPFVAIHMASQGYWQIQDEHTTDTTGSPG
jgi:hypothetical protein